MPTYEYLCKACGHTLEEFQSITEPPLQTCPKCHTDNLARVMGTGAGLIFKGTGFYLTDYKKSGEEPAVKKPAASPEQKAEDAKSPPSGSSPSPPSSSKTG